jgi:hypothetical protein
MSEEIRIVGVETNAPKVLRNVCRDCKHFRKSLNPKTYPPDGLYCAVDYKHGIKADTSACTQFQKNGTAWGKPNSVFKQENGAVE